MPAARQLSLGPPLTSQSAFINTTATLQFTIFSSSPPILSKLFTSPLPSFLEEQLMHAVDIPQKLARRASEKQPTCLSSSTPSFSAPPYKITEAMPALSPPKPSSNTTTNETRDNDSHQLYPHNIS